VIFRILDHLDMLAEPEGEPTRGPPEESAITGACPAPRWRKLIEDDLRWELKRGEKRVQLQKAAEIQPEYSLNLQL
jgi:hypothetical protein